MLSRGIAALPLLGARLRRVVQRQVLYLGEINDTQELAWRKSIEVLEDGTAADADAVSRGSL